MSVSGELVWLVNQLRNAANPRERLRLLALGWRTLRGLSPADRLRVARELGFDGAERLVEQLARRGGMSPSLLLGVLRKAEGTDPGRLTGMVQGLLDEDRRRGTVDQILDEVSEWAGEAADEVSSEIVDEAGAEEGPDEVSVSLAEATPDEEEGPPRSTLAVAMTAAAGAAAVAAQELRALEESEADRVAEPPPLPEPRPEAETPPEPELEERPEAEAEAEAPPEPEMETEAEADPIPESEALPIPGEERPIVEPPPPEIPLPAPVQSRVDSAAVTAALAEQRSLTGRLRELERLLSEPGELEVEELHELLESFPEGWARRRALQTMLRHGRPRRFDRALEVAATFERPSDRMWALTTLAARELEPEEEDALLEAADSVVLKRRLRLRMRHG